MARGVAYLRGFGVAYGCVVAKWFARLRRFSGGLAWSRGVA